MSSLSIVASPVQLLNAIEAHQHFGSDDNVLVIKYPRAKSTNKQMDKLLLLYKWSEVVRIPRSRYLPDSLYDFLILRKVQKMKRDYDYIFIGNYMSSNMLLFANNLPNKAVYLLDDGLITVIVQKRYLATNKMPTHHTLLDGIKKVLVKLLFQNSYVPRQPINLFTYYELPAHNGQLVVRNELAFLKRILATHTFELKEDIVYFLGAPLSEENIVSEDYFMLLMGRIIRACEKGRFIYVQHRREKKSKLELLKKRFQIEVMNFDIAVELGFMEARILPDHISSMYSSALISLSKLYPGCKVESFLIPDTEIHPKHVERVSDCYSYLKKVIEVVDLNKKGADAASNMANLG